MSDTPTPEEDEAQFQALMDRMTRRRDRTQSEQTTDDEGNPLPRIDLDDPASATTDPLLRVGYALRSRLTDDWLTATLMVSAAGTEVRMFALITRERDQPAPPEHLLYLPEVAAACATLRESMYEADGRGTWYGLYLRLNRNGTMVTRYDYDGPPFMQWGPGDAELLRRDHELYPRPPELLPDWHPSR